MAEEPKGIGCIVLSVLLLTIGAVLLYLGIMEAMRGTPLVGEPQWREARGGETLPAGQRAEPGDMIKSSDSIAVGEHVEYLLVGAGGVLLGLFGLRTGIRLNRRWKSRRREEE